MPSEATTAIVWITRSRTWIARAKEKYRSKSWRVCIDVAMEVFTCHKHGFIQSSLNVQNTNKNTAKNTLWT